MSTTVWMVLNSNQDRILLKTGSCLAAFRLARRRVGGAAHLERANGFGVLVTGHRLTLTVVPVAANGKAIESAALPGLPRAELVSLPGGRSFIWVPAA